MAPAIDMTPGEEGENLTKKKKKKSQAAAEKGG